MKYSVATAPSTEPLTFADAKIHLRTITGDTTEDAAIIAPMIAAAREYCENITGRALAPQTIEAYPDTFSDLIQLPRPPLVSVSSIKYTDDDWTETTMSSSDYVIDLIGGTIGIKTIPDFTPAIVNPIKITYSAGYSALPKAIRQAMLLLVGHWYSNREAVVVGAVTSIEIEITVKRLLNQYKVWWY